MAPMFCLRARLPCYICITNLHVHTHSLCRVMPETQYPDVDDMFKAQKARVWLRMYGTFSFLPLLLGGEGWIVGEGGGVVKQNLATALTNS